MSFLAEIAVALVAGLAQLVIFVVWNPLKFLFHSGYRAEVLARRRSAPKRFYFELIFGSAALSAVIALLATATYSLCVKNPEEQDPKKWEAKAREWLQKKRAEDRTN